MATTEGQHAAWIVLGGCRAAVMVAWCQGTFQFVIRDKVCGGKVLYWFEPAKNGWVW